LSLIKAFGNAVFISEDKKQAEELVAGTLARLKSEGPAVETIQLDRDKLINAGKDKAGFNPAQNSVFMLGSTDLRGFRKLEERPEFSGYLQFVLAQKQAPQTKRDKSVLIIGATSFFGNAVYQLFSRAYKEARGTGFSKAASSGFDKLDATSEEEIREYFSRWSAFDIVIYISGEANADVAEKGRARAHKLNVDAVTYLSRYAGNCKFAYISSEYVFDGKSGPYGSASRPEPINYYGRSKLEGEKAALDNFSDVLILRLGALYGYNGPGDKETTVSKLIASMEKSEPLKADNLQIKRPLLLEDAAGTLLKLLDYGVSGIYQVNGPEGLNKEEMARRIAAVRREMTGCAFAYPIIGIEQPGIAAKPLNTHMVNIDTPRPFNEGIRFLLRKQKGWKESNNYEFS
jgi:dTDP-4-dehydrorhamnose reductase